MSSKTEFEEVCLRPNLFPQFASWVEETKVAPYKYRCNACCRVYEMSNMGQQSVTNDMSKSKNIRDLYQLERKHLIWKICCSLVCLFKV